MATPIPPNSCSFTLAEVAAATGGALRGSAEAIVSGVTTDSRVARAGSLFVALRGPHFDGHQYLGAAIAQGAAAAIVERGRSVAELACVEVEDTLRALGALASHHLQRIRAVTRLPVIAIGGANGKTTTKELTAALAAARFGATLKTPGNLNNLIGVPMTLFTLTETHRAAVIECGTNRRGEVAALACILTPDVALVLNVDIEHSEGLGTIDEIADEESSLFRGAGVAVASAEEPKVTARIPAGMRAVTFGAASTGADVGFIRRPSPAPERAAITLRLAPALLEAGVARELEVNLRLLGPAAASNAAAALAAVAAASAAHLSRAQLEALARAFEGVEPVSGRLRARTLDGVVVIDDTYNANPRSVRVALATASEIAHARSARLIIALGDMLELGPLSDEMHRQAVRDVAAAAPDQFVAVGPSMGAACQAVLDGTPLLFVRTYPDSREAASAIRAIVRRGDVLLVKGSRGLEMEKLIEALEQTSD
ncbi:MAG TPA: UDP-N-acetylmuramoyl-tripeptide--D-alanyl-D-alanine ligase [Candidatus Binataceae bacterium]|nr:UDP-N-acetylmuramoyl-tripeptide--D-alanyl-D-alanine ligase [Candidatus Binataceae bacterium]